MSATDDQPVLRHSSLNPHAEKRRTRDLALADIDQGCLAAVLAGGQTWARFKADAEQRTGLPWAQIKILIDERHVAEMAL